MHEMFSFGAALPLHLFEYTLRSSRSEQHWHSFYEIGYCAEGSGVFHLGERTVPVARGDVLLFPPYESHIGESDPGAGCRCYFAYFGETLFQEEDRPLLLAFRQAWARDEHTIRLGMPEFPPLGEWFPSMLVEYENKPPGYKSLLRARMLELCLRLHRVEESRHSRESWNGMMGSLAQIKPALDYMERHFREPIELPDIARVLSLSPSRARHLFRATVGKRFREYLTFIRIQEAKRLLATGSQSVTAIYLSCGFQSSAPFYRSFRDLVGLAPIDYRERLKIED